MNLRAAGGWPHMAVCLSGSRQHVTPLTKFSMYLIVLMKLASDDGASKMLHVLLFCDLSVQSSLLARKKETKNSAAGARLSHALFDGAALSACQHEQKHHQLVQADR
jgi:hypothetical protein